METKLKLTIAIEQQRIGYYGRGEVTITDMLFSDSIHHIMNADELIAEVKQAIKSMKGWSMITISLTDGLMSDVYPKAVNEVRFVNSYGDIKRANVSQGTFTNWNEAKIKELYEDIKVFVNNANYLQLGKLRANKEAVTN